VRPFPSINPINSAKPIDGFEAWHRLINAGGGFMEGNRERHGLEIYQEDKGAVRERNIVGLLLVGCDQRGRERGRRDRESERESISDVFPCGLASGSKVYS
jgi:hypothetical protein